MPLEKISYDLEIVLEMCGCFHQDNVSVTFPNAIDDYNLIKLY